MAKPAVFLDTSIFITALLSSKGGAFYILNNFQDRLDFQTSEYVLDEIEEVLQNIFPNKNNMRTELFLLLGAANINILPNPSKPEVVKLHKYISAKDAPILAWALAASDYLLTLDNEFFGKEIITLADRQGLKIFKPKELIELYR